MNQQYMNLDKLNALSRDELWHLAAWLGMDVPEGMERTFLISEIIEAVMEENEEKRESMGGALGIEDLKFRSSELDTAGLVDSNPDTLPESCSQSRLRLFPRDPVWAYASWKLSDADLDSIRLVANARLVLRLLAVTGANEGKRATVPAFDMEISADDCDWYVNIPEPGMTYVVEIVQEHGGKKFFSLRSNVIQSPRNRVFSETSLGEDAKALLDLSGIARFTAAETSKPNPQRILG